MAEIASANAVGVCGGAAWHILTAFNLLLP